MTDNVQKVPGAAALPENPMELAPRRPGWCSHEAVTLDEHTRKQLEAAGEEDLYQSDASPLGILFNQAFIVFFFIVFFFIIIIIQYINIRI